MLKRSKVQVSQISFIYTGRGPTSAWQHLKVEPALTSETCAVSQIHNIFFLYSIYYILIVIV